MHSSTVIYKIVLDILRKNKGILLFALLGVFFLGISQSFLLLAIGPILKYMLSNPESTVLLTEFIPEKVIKLFSIDIRFLKMARLDFVFYLSVFVFSVVCLKAVSHFVYHYFHQVLVVKIIETFRVHVFSKVLAQDYESFRKWNQGQWMSLLINDIQYFQSKISEISTALLRDGVLVLSCLLTLLWLHWPSAMVLFLSSPLVLWYMGRTSKNISSYTKYWQTALGDIAGIVLQQRMRFDFMYAQNAVPYELDYFQRKNLDFYHKIRRSIAVRSSFAPLLEFFAMSLFIGCILIFNFYPTIYPPDQVVQIFAALALLFRPWRSIGEQLTAWYETKSVLQRLNQNIGSLGETSDRYLERGVIVPSYSEEDSKLSSIHIERMELRHPSFRVQYNNLSFEFAKAYAFMGESGTGKSSFLKVLAGLYKPSKYRADIDLNRLKNFCSYVSQENFLFNASIYENIFYANSDREIAFGSDEYFKLVELCNLSDLMKNFGNKLEVVFNPTRTNLSGGQIQRICILRALLRNKPILLLDEITSALDVESEAQIFSNLMHYIREKNYMILAVTHRESSMKFFDHIYKMDLVSNQNFPES